MNFETKEQLINRLKRQKLFLEQENIKKLRNKKKNIIYNVKSNNNDILPKSQRDYINFKNKFNKDKIKLEKEVDPKFKNISQLKSATQLLIKDIFEDTYNEGDVIEADVLENELSKIDDKFKSNFLTIMNIKDFGVIDNKYKNDYEKRRFFVVNFNDFKNKLKEKYVSLNINELSSFLDEYYNNPKNVLVKESIKNKYNNQKQKINNLRRQAKIKKNKIDFDSKMKPKSSSANLKRSKSYQQLSILNSQIDKIEDIIDNEEIQNKMNIDKNENVDEQIELSNKLDEIEKNLLNIENDNKIDVFENEEGLIEEKNNDEQFIKDDDEEVVEIKEKGEINPDEQFTKFLQSLSNIFNNLLLTLTNDEDKDKLKTYYNNIVSGQIPKNQKMIEDIINKKFSTISQKKNIIKIDTKLKNILQYYIKEQKFNIIIPEKVIKQDEQINEQINEPEDEGKRPLTENQISYYTKELNKYKDIILDKENKEKFIEKIDNLINNLEKISYNELYNNKEILDVEYRKAKLKYENKRNDLQEIYTNIVSIKDNEDNKQLKKELKEKIKDDSIKLNDDGDYDYIEERILYYNKIIKEEKIKKSVDIIDNIMNNKKKENTRMVFNILKEINDNLKKLDIIAKELKDEENKKIISQYIDDMVKQVENIINNENLSEKQKEEQLKDKNEEIKEVQIFTQDQIKLQLLKDKLLTLIDESIDNKMLEKNQTEEINTIKNIIKDSTVYLTLTTDISTIYTQHTQITDGKQSITKLGIILQKILNSNEPFKLSKEATDKLKIQDQLLYENQVNILSKLKLEINKEVEKYKKYPVIYNDIKQRIDDTHKKFDEIVKNTKQNNKYSELREEIKKVYDNLVNKALYGKAFDDDFKNLINTRKVQIITEKNENIEDMVRFIYDIYTVTLQILTSSPYDKTLISKYKKELLKKVLPDKKKKKKK